MSTLSAIRGTANVLYSKLFVTLPVPESSVDLSDHVIVVTGANTGLGLESVRHLSRLGVGKIIMTVRDLSKGQSAKKNVLVSTKQPESSIEIWTLDMNSYDSIRSFAQRARKDLARLDGVLANAGVMTPNFSTTQGNESSLHVNVIATALLYALLYPQMRESGIRTGNPCRFSIPNSALHHMAPVKELEPQDGKILKRLNDRQKADMTGRYSLTKLLVIYVVRALAARSTGSASNGEGSVIINTPNPSFCVSGLANEMRDQPGFENFEKLLARTTEEGSRVLVHGILAGPETTGQYLSNCQIYKPSTLVTSKCYQEMQKAFVGELFEKLEQIEPGVTSTF